ncbi:MAG TPA: 3-oxoacyl-ACP reductase family protein [Candidatus Udaeobacter sp.]|jgi:NAD(P)-dependent dehydrogenase (short-subunit alcohol dehydrogenase family)|nr:3-oxoacyl-ACP reductase family protein [Candidatus Udaeobacter sp.]
MDKVIIVTGGAGGIGSELCRALASDGLKVVIGDYALNAAEKIAAEIKQTNGEAIAVQVDVGDKQNVAAMVRQALNRFGRIDYLLNGAGVMTRVPVVDMAEEEWDRVLRINLKGTFLCSQAVAKHMIPQKAGRIISIASGRGVAGQPRSAHYAASKAGIIAFTKSLAVELAPYEITVNAIAPGATDTPMSRSGSTPDEFKKRGAIPPLLNGLTKKEEIVGLIRYLLSDPTRYVTGQTFFLRTPK